MSVATLQTIITCVAFGIVIFAFLNIGKRRLRYFFCLSVVVFIHNLGYTIEVNAPTFESALIGIKMIFFGGSYVGIFCFLFCMDYMDKPAKLWVTILLALFPVLVNILVVTWPAQTLMYSEMKYVPTIVGAHMENKLGPLYNPYFIYTIGLTFFSFVYMARHLIRSRVWQARDGIFVAVCLIPVAFYLLILFDVVPRWHGWFEPIPTIEAGILLLLTLYIRLFGRQEWHSLGRELVVQNIQDAYILVDTRGCFLDANEIAFGYFPELRWFRNGTPLARLGPVAEKLLGHDAQENSPLILEPSEGGTEQKYLRISRSPLRVNEKKIGVAIMLYDNTERERLIIQLQEAQQLVESAEQATSSKSTFLATMSHEMRTPLNAVIGLSEVLLQSDLPDSARNDVEKIYTSGASLLGIINDILDISKIETGNLELILADYDVASLVNDVLQVNIVRRGSKPITFALKIDERIPQRLRGDELRIRQIFNNLLSNAFKYTHEGSVILYIDWVRDDSGALLSIRVQDTGQGIRREDIGRLFSEYGQLNSKANRNIEGTGLGLSITKRLTEMMGGAIDVESEYGKGSTFSVTLRQEVVDALPIGRATADSLAQFRFSTNRRGKQQVLTVLPPGKQILVVDDMETNLYVARSLLKPYGVEVACAKRGKEAVTLIHEERRRFDLVFMDHMMPEMDGLEATSLIRALGTDYARDIPIIALTANALVGMREMFLANGFSGYLSKPIDGIELDQILAKWLAL
jgi:signal transduction histidine kinase/CheY-like chemotaxis protein